MLPMAHRFVHHVAQVLAPDGAPLFLTDGLREYATASDPLQKDAEEAIFDQQPADRTPGCKRR